MTLLVELEEFVTEHRPHGALTAVTGGIEVAGYQLEVACPCGVTFERWITPREAAEDLTDAGAVELIVTIDNDRASRRRTLYAALGFCQLAEHPSMPEVTALKRWLGTWSGIGHIVVGMERQGYAVALRKIHDDGRSASFHDHPMLAPQGFATAPTPFAAVQQAAWRVLNHKPITTSISWAGRQPKRRTLKGRSYAGTGTASKLQERGVPRRISERRNYPTP